MTVSPSNDHLHSRIRSRAVKLGYDLAKIEPVFDRVADVLLRVCYLTTGKMPDAK